MAMVSEQRAAHTGKGLAQVPLAGPAGQAQARRAQDAGPGLCKVAAHTPAVMCMVAYKNVQARAGADVHTVEVELELKAW